MNVADVGHLSNTQASFDITRLGRGIIVTRRRRGPRNPFQTVRRPFFPENILPQLLCRHNLLPAISNLARVVQHTSKPVRRSGNLIAVPMMLRNTHGGSCNWALNANRLIHYEEA
jgi:hypothetical protein